MDCGLFLSKTRRFSFYCCYCLCFTISISENTKYSCIYASLYPTASFLFLLSLYSEYGTMTLLWLLVIVASTDIGAYFVGKSIGKTKFCETSPNKTIEGVIGGVIFAVLLGTLFSTNGITFVNALIISAIVSIVSIFGDLFESYLKEKLE